MLKRSPIDDDADGEPGGAPDGAVLVLNEDTDACELVARLIEHVGFDVVRFYDPASVVDQLAEGGFSAVVIDSLGTGISSAFAVLDGVRAAEPRLRDTAVLILAATDTNRLFAYQSGVDAYVVRPFHADELVESVRSTVARSLEDRAHYRNVQLMGGAATS